MPDHHAFLCLLADSLLTSLAEGADSTLVHVIETTDGGDVGLLPLDGAAPAEFLLGMVAPADWSALGVATRGRSRPLDGHGPSSTAEIVVLVPRVGEVIGRMRHGGEVVKDPPAYGLTLDCLQRALGLPAAPPQVPVVHFVATAYLEAVLRTGGDPSTMEMMAPGLEWGSLGWDRLRQLAIEDGWPSSTLSLEDAAWLDDGSFSRWILDGRLPLPALLAEVAATVGMAEARECTGVLAGLGINVDLPALPNRRERRRRRAG